MAARRDDLAVVVVGAAGGIGAAIARRLARDGARLLLADIGDVDVADWDSVVALARRAQNELGPVDAVINCAGILSPGRLDSLAPDDLRREVEVNLIGTILLTRAFLPAFRARSRGHFIHLASLGGTVPMPRGAVYTATKFGVRGFCLAMDLELRGSGVRVTALSPDSVATPMLAAEAAGGGSPLSFAGVALHPDDIAAAVARALRRPLPEVMVPAGRGWLARLANLSPRVMAAVYTRLDRHGERGRQRYLRERKGAPSAPARLASAAFARAYVTTMRPYLLFVSGFTGLLGLALTVPLPLGPALAVATAFFLAYGFGQALTDCFQTDTDRLSAPYRPLVRGEVRRRDVLAVSLAGLGVCGIVLIACHRLNAVLALADVAGLATYTSFKRRWWGGPWYNAWIVALLVAMGFAAGSGLAERPLRWRPELGWALALSFFSYANFVLAGYFKDVAADRATGYRTIPVVHGRRVAAWMSDGLAFAAAASLLPLVMASQRAGVWLVFAAAGGGATVGAQILLHRVRHDDEAHRPIALTVHAHILLAAAGAAALAPAWAPALGLGYAAFLGVLRARPMKEQV